MDPHTSFLDSRRRSIDSHMNNNMGHLVLGQAHPMKATTNPLHLWYLIYNSKEEFPSLGQTDSHLQSAERVLPRA